MMKSRRRGRPPQQPPPEECGVWLDASHMKKKKSQQAVILCLSSRFNPLSRRQSDSVLVEFTQTKSPQLHTKQTSMYSFFSPAGNKNKQYCTTDNNTLIQETSPEFEGRNEQEVRNVVKPSATGPSMCLSQSYIDYEPAEDQERTSFYKMHKNREQSGGMDNYDWSGVLGKHCNHDSGVSIFRSQEESLKPRTNYWATGFGCKHQNNLSHSTISKCSDKEYKTKDTFPSSQFEDQLFTQDTQGNRVICHRFMNEPWKSTCSSLPLQDKTNVTGEARSPMKESLQNLSHEDSLQKMFTQNSEGNLVIRH